jgi:hypothetical protein
MPPASSCMTTSQPGRTSSPPRPAGRLLAWRSARAGPSARVIAFIEKHPSLLAGILQAQVPVVAGKEGRHREAECRRSDVRSFGEEETRPPDRRRTCFALNTEPLSAAAAAACVPKQHCTCGLPDIPPLGKSRQRFAGEAGRSHSWPAGGASRDTHNMRNQRDQTHGSRAIMPADEHDRTAYISSPSPSRRDQRSRHECASRSTRRPRHGLAQVET